MRGPFNAVQFTTGSSVNYLLREIVYIRKRNVYITSFENNFMVYFYGDHSVVSQK